MKQITRVAWDICYGFCIASTVFCVCFGVITLSLNQDIRPIYVGMLCHLFMILAHEVRKGMR